jgi:hypothetical protein
LNQINDGKTQFYLKINCQAKSLRAFPSLSSLLFSESYSLHIYCRIFFTIASHYFLIISISFEYCGMKKWMNIIQNKTNIHFTQTMRISFKYGSYFKSKILTGFLQLFLIIIYMIAKSTGQFNSRTYPDPRY